MRRTDGTAILACARSAVGESRCMEVECVASFALCCARPSPSASGLGDASWSPLVTQRRSPSTLLQLNFRGGRLGRLGGTGGGGGNSGKGGNGAGSISWTLGGGGGDDKRRTNGGGGGPMGGGGGEIWSVARTGICVARTEVSI